MGIEDTGWQARSGQFPWPPPNPQVVSPMFTGALDIRWDDPSQIDTGPQDSPFQATGAITVAGTPAVEVDASGTIMVLVVPVPGSTLTIGGVILTAVPGPRTSGGNDFDVSLGTAVLVAADIVAAINDPANDLGGLVVATAVGNVVTLTPGVPGAAGNDITLETDSAAFALSGPTLLGGVDASTITFGGVAVLTAVAGARTPGGNDFSADGTPADVATSIAAAIQDPQNIFAGLVTAAAQFGIVALTAVPVGYAGNAIALETDTPTVFTLSGDTLAGGQGDRLCAGKSNSQWTIVGVNVYRSDNGERGPYIRVNKLPIGSMFYRDFTDNAFVEDEIVRWDAAWVSKGDAGNDRRWAFKTERAPIVKATETPPLYHNARMVVTHANAPSDVVVRIDGVEVPVHSVFGRTGEITLINQATYDLAREKFVPAVLPRADGTSVVTVSYWYNRNAVGTALDRTTQTFYRLTTVALDPSSPSGLVETPLGYSTPISVAQVETLDYIWREAIRRNSWILQQGGERVKLFKRKVSGIPCPCRIDERTQEYLDQGDLRCRTCFGSGWVGGYDGPIDIIIAPDDAERRVTQTPIGRKLDHTYEVWTGPSPAITQRDFIVKQTGERYSIGPVRRPSSRGLALQQHFNIGYLDEGSIQYRIPVEGLTELPWPQTRPTDPNTVCDPKDPYPVGFDYQATPMETEVPKIPDGREIRGRTPVWSNLTYGGKGS